MSYLFYPNLTQNCKDVSHCPHLGGAALGSIVLSANANDEWLQALLRQIDGLRYDNDAKQNKIEELQRQVEQLKAELKVERQKQFKRTVADEPIDEVAGSTTMGAKKRGAPVGHPGWFRPTPTHFDRVVPVPSPAICPHCKGAVKTRTDLAPYDHLQEDWLDGRTATTCFRHEEGRCCDAVLQRRRGCRWHRRWKTGEAADNEEAAWLRREQRRLENVAVNSEKARTLQNRIRRYTNEWLTFLKHPGVPPTNNLAEQAVRCLVILRKLTFGNRTHGGARRMGALMTVIQTAKRQGRNVIDFLASLFILTPNQAARAMYARR